MLILRSTEDTVLEQRLRAMSTLALLNLITAISSSCPHDFQLAQVLISDAFFWHDYTG